MAHPVQAAPAGTTGAADGVCNEQVPNNSVYARFLWVVRFLTHNNFYVVIDNHLAPDNTAVVNPAQWAALWAQVPAPFVLRSYLRAMGVHGSAIHASVICNTYLEYALYGRGTHSPVTVMLVQIFYHRHGSAQLMACGDMHSS